MSPGLEKRASLTPALAVLASIISLTVGTSYGKQLFAVIGPQGTATIRIAFGSLILLAVWRPWRMPLSGRDAKIIALYGGTLGLMNLMFYMAISTLPLGIAIAIEFIGPLTVAITSSRRAIDFLWIGFAVVGLILLLPVTPAGAGISLVGVGFALASALLWGLYIVFGKKAENIHAGQCTSLGMFFGALLILPFGVAHAGTALLNPALLLSGLALAVASSAVPYSLEMYALKRMRKNAFGILMSLEPAVGALAGLIILREQLTLVQWIAISSIVAASIGSSTGAGESGEVSAKDVPADSL